MDISRQLQSKVASKMGKGKAIIIIGPRQVGKTTLIKNVIGNQTHLFLDGEDPVVRKRLTNPNTQELKAIIGKHKIVFIDEVQRIKNIGVTLKIITDQMKGVQLMVSGSSAFDLNNSIEEPLTGRKWEFQLFPISWKELEDHIGILQADQQLELRLLYGMYPKVTTNIGEEVEVLKQITDSYLFKDILSYSGIRRPDILDKLLQALALQVGNEVSYNELAQLIGVDKNTISNYINLLEQGFIVFRLTSFSGNLRNEIKTNQKIYFYDNGIRNMILGNFNSLDVRNDVGALWENFLISERKKLNNYKQSLTRSYFWRTVSLQEIDYIEEKAGKVSAYEIKWHVKAKLKIHKAFTEAYQAKTELVNRDNFRTFITL
jgi:uncharacterized protein